MVGFKSFAARTILEFHRGVTAVVGPNGCGKSNVLDAIRWVLGEQSAKALRGGEMADVIFSGTDSRAALGMAEVSLTFADCENELGVEWNEVRVTRRLFRDGKSEYQLNKQSCRLRDIHQLFMDTGIGRSAYSIMEQGKIDQILSSRPEDRRAIFEEAAGITKYKAQKKEALRKLEYTEANLLRVGDIIKEVRRQIGSLQRQAAKARRYQALMEDLRTFDTHLSHRKYAGLKEEHDRLETDLSSGERRREEMQQEIERKEIELTDERAGLEALDAKASDVRDHIQQLNNRVFSAESKIQTNGERCHEFLGMIERANEEVERSRTQLNNQVTEVEETDRMISQILETLRTRDEELAEAEALVAAARDERVNAERALNDATHALSNAEAQLSQYRSEISSADARRESAESRLHGLEDEQSKAEHAVREFENAVRDFAEQLEFAKAEVVRAQEAVDRGQHDYDSAHDARQEADADSNAAAKSLAESQSRLDVLRQLNEAGEGLGEGAQALLKGLDNPDFFKPAIAGSLASLLDVEPEYVTAVEAALGPNLQAVVLKDVAVAEAAIATLEGKKLGRGAVLPREWAPADPGGDSAPLPEGALGWAKDYVRAENEAAGLVHRLLDRVAVVPDLASAFQLKSRFPEMPFVTPDGCFITTDGVVHGGQGGDAAASALLRRRQIAELGQEVARKEKAAEEATAKRQEAIENWERSQSVLRELRDELQQAQVRVSSLQNEHRVAERQLSDATNRRQSLENEADQLRQQIESHRQRSAESRLKLEQAEKAADERRDHIEASRQEIESLRDREREASEELSQIRLRAATEREQRESLVRQRQPMDQRIEELERLIAQRTSEVEGYQKRMESLRAESAELQNSLGGWQQEIAEWEESLRDIRTRRDAAANVARDRENELHALRDSAANVQEQRGKTEVRITQLSLRMESVTEHIQRRYQLDVSEFRPDLYGLRKALRDREAKSKKTQTVATSDEPENDTVETQESAEAIAEPIEPKSVAQNDPEDTEENDFPWERIEELVGELTDKVDSMGPVNIDAIQEYDELEERQKFLEQQNNDLINSKEELHEVISRINKTTRELFAETFSKVRVNFQEMFTELFGGGKANLILQDESDPLESGIDIIAKPPGKQLKSVTLLSGGERTMTAVSLLFAIYMVKPSPFCVLDEMDAPLDESNINRFVKILDRFVEQSQFVVITHNKRTIGRADMLYGVTMEEHGISKLVSVRFTNSSNGHAGNAPLDPAGEAPSTPSIAESFGKRGDLHSESTVGVS